MNKIIRGKIDKIDNIEISIKQVDAKESIYGKIDQFIYSIILDNGKKYTTVTNENHNVLFLNMMMLL